MSPAAKLARLQRTSRNGRSSRKLSLFIAALTVLLSGRHAFAAGPLPQGGRFVGGSGSIAQNGTNLNIAQTGSRGIIEWDSFSIGRSATVSISNGTGATLNRVTGNDFSAIMGTLNGTGSVYLVNPHGVLIGRNGVVSTGGRFVASTLDITNDTFLNPPAIGGSLYTGNSTANVINLGKLMSSGGDVFLVSANKVTNAGTIDAPNGNAELAVGRQVRLFDDNDRQVSVDLGSSGTVTNTGTVQAAIINLQAADGNIVALAGHSGALRATGTATRAGHVWLVANTETATSVINTGSVDARRAQISARNADGSGGAVDMSGKEVEVGGADVQAKTWNITTGDFIADASTARTLSASLSRGASINVNANGGDGMLGATGEGNIAIDASIRWHGAGSLTLDATHSLSIAPNATIANHGTGSLILNADWAGFDNGGSVTNLGTIDWSRSTGIVTALYDMNGSYMPGRLRSNPSWSAAPFSGLVTQITAYELVNYLADLNAVNNNLAGNYAMGNRAIASQSLTDFNSIGSAATPFTGQFDGMGHGGISGLNISAGADTGLFAVIGKTGVVRNFGFYDSAATSSGGPIGLLAGINYGLIVRASAFGTVQSTGDTSSVAGGMVGENRGRVEQSFAAVSVSGAGTVGGLAGTNDGCIDQSIALGTVTGGPQATLGGLVGVNNGRINQSISEDIVRGGVNGGAVVGGIVGRNAGVIRESYSQSTLKPDPGATTGGIAGINSGSIAPDVFWNSESSGATAGVGSGTPVADASGLTNAQLLDRASFGPTWDFSATGTWVMYGPPTLRWLAGP